jgi:GxxExxY protein
MPQKSRDVIQGAGWLQSTYKIIGLAMEVHNDLGPGHREAIYHDTLVAKFKAADILFEDEPHILISLDDGTVVGGSSPDFVVEESVIVELKARPYGITRDDEAQVLGYFAVLPQCPVALFLNFGRPRLEYRRLLPPKNIQAFQREKWSR